MMKKRLFIQSVAYAALLAVVALSGPNVLPPI